MLYVYRFLWLVYTFKEVCLQIFKCVSFWFHGCCWKWEGWARKPVNHTSWVALVTPTDGPKSVRKRCAIVFCGVICVVTLPFWHFCWCRGFCHRTETDLFLFLLSKGITWNSICTTKTIIVSNINTLGTRIKRHG